MTVKDLIAKLQKLPLEHEVCLSEDYDKSYWEIDSLDVITLSNKGSVDIPYVVIYCESKIDSSY